MSKMLKKAILLAIEVHDGQFDKYGMPYITHPMRVMQAGCTEDEKIVGILHDVIEDSDMTEGDLREMGFDDRIVNAVVALSKRDDESYDEYIDRVKENQLAIRVKLMDLTDNMDIRRIPEMTEKVFTRLKKYHRAYGQLIDLLK